MKKDNIIFLTANVIFVLMAIVLVWFWKKLPPELPWFYSLPWGEKQLITKEMFGVISAGVWGLLWLTKLMARFLARTDEIVRTTIIIGGLMMTILYSASFFRVLRLFLK